MKSNTVLSSLPLRLRQHRPQDALGPGGDDAVRHLRHAALPHVGLPDGHPARPDLHLPVRERVLPGLQQEEGQEGRPRPPEEAGAADDAAAAAVPDAGGKVRVDFFLKKPYFLMLV